MPRFCTRWATSITLGLLTVFHVHARPPSIFSPVLYEDFEIKIYTQDGPHFGDVEELIFNLDESLQMSTDCWPSAGISGDERGDQSVTEGHDLGGGFLLSHHAPDGVPFEYSIVLANYGVLLWLRQWRDVGWVPPAYFTTTWNTGYETETTYGTLGRVATTSGRTSKSARTNNTISSASARLAATSYRRRDLGGDRCNLHRRSVARRTFDLSNATKIEPTKVNKLNATALGALPPDPWSKRGYGGYMRDDEYRMRVSDYGNNVMPVNDVFDLIMDCTIRHALEWEHEANNPDDTPKQQPVTCGKRGLPQIFLNGNSESQVRYKVVSFGEVQDALRLMRDFYVEYQKVGYRWVPSVRNYRGESWYPGETVYSSVAVGWWGKPHGIEPVLDGSKLSNGTNVLRSTDQRNDTVDITPQASNIDIRVKPQ